MINDAYKWYMESAEVYDQAKLTYMASRQRLCHTLKFTREKLGIAQGEAAAYIGTTQAHLSLIESGKRYPSEKTLEKLMNLYDNRD